MTAVHVTPGSRAAFRHPAFRLYWTAQLISMMGTFMQLVALGYLVYDLTGSKWLLGTISALQMGPSLLLSLPAGVLADRVSRSRIILGTQTTALVLASCLATLTALHRLQVWEILVISTISGIAIALESPARQAFISELVGREDLANAIGWNSLVLNGARVLGPAIGGIAIRFVGEAPIFYFNSFSFLAMIVALLLMRLPAGNSIPQRRPLRALADGLSYIKRTPSIIAILVLTAFVATFIMNFAVFMPILARDVLRTGAEGLGWMWTATGLGAVVGSFTVVRWSWAAVRGPLLLVSAVIAAFSLMALAGASTLSTALPLLVTLGWSTGAFFASANSAVQHRVPDDFRGRVLSVYSMIFAGTTPIGGLLVATVASAGGARLSLVIAGGISLLATVSIVPFFLRHLRSPAKLQPSRVTVERAS